MFKIKIKYLFLLLIPFLGLACKSKKVLLENNNKISTVLVPNYFKELDSLNDNSLKFNTLLIKFSATMISGKNELSTTGTVKILNDSIILISVTPVLGIELMKIRITETELIVLNRVNKTYYLEGMDNLHNLLGIDLNYNQIQSIFLNKLCTFPDSLNFKKDYAYTKINRNDSTFSKFSRRGNLENKQNYIHNVQIDLNTKTYSNFNFEITESMKNLEVIYRKFETLNSVLFPMIVQINLQNKNTITKFNVDMNKIEVNKELNFAFSIPSKYSKQDVLTF